MSFSDFEQGIKATDIKARQKQQQANERAAMLLERWHESERVLNILRTIQPKTSNPNMETIDAWRNKITI